MHSHVLMNTATNSRTLMWSLPGGWGPYRGGSDVRTGQPRSRRYDDDMRHLNGGSQHQPPRPSYEASVQLTRWGVRGIRRPRGRLQMESAAGLARSWRTKAMSRLM